MSQRNSSITATLSFFVMLFCATIVQSADYQHSLKVKDMTFDWSVDGDQLAVKLSAPTKGWVAVGFNPSARMQDANIIMGYVKNGKVKIVDHFGTAATMHQEDSKIGGSENVTAVGGTEVGDTTTIEFKIPLNSGDAKDGVIDPAADTTVILAYGPERDSFRMKHDFRDSLVVNLGTGEQK